MAQERRLRRRHQPRQVGFRIRGAVAAQPNQGELGHFGQDGRVGFPATHLQTLEKHPLERELLPVEAGPRPTVFDH